MNYKDLVSKYKDKILKDLEGLIAIDSVLDKYDPSNLEAPFGEGPRKALDFISSIATRDGFSNKNYHNHVVEINYGEQKNFIVMAGHVDVVPIGSGWNTDPFKMVYEKKTDMLRGRGTLDDKGPGLAAYYALKIIKDQNIKLDRRVKLLFGADEESGSRCIKKYNEIVTEVPDYGFIPDAEFPLIFSEKGILRVDILIKNTDILNVSAPNVYNMVPEYSTIEFIDKCIKKASGKAAHGSLPELGENAILKLAYNLDKEGIENDLTYILNNYFILKAKKFMADTKGELLGIKTTNPETGNLSLNLGVLAIEGDYIKLGIDIRYPSNTTKDKIIKSIQETLDNSKVKCIVKEISNSDPLYFSPVSKLVKTLESIYRKHTGDNKTPILAIGGGTYAREFKNTIAFGAEFPNREPLMHAPNEGYPLKDLLQSIEIYIAAIIALANLD